MKKILIVFSSLLSFTSSTIIPTATNSLSYKTQIDNQTVNVNISAYDKNNQKLMTYHYETKFDTLGKLMAQEPNTYLFKDFSNPLGLYLYGINYYDAKGNKQTKLEEPNETFWALWYINDQGQEEFSSVGVSSYYLTHKIENIIWRYTNIWKY